MWDSIVGHLPIVSLLRRVARSERVGHAYLFVGQRGVGKYTLAKAFAAHILCLSNQGPCGVCESCRLLASDSNPDLVEILPQGQSFRISQIRELNRHCLLRPSLGTRRVYILHNVEKLTADAANSFLRTLEEPPPHVTFVLLASTQDVISTILSRCQVLRFPSLTYDETLAVVRASGILPAEKAEQIAKRGLGSPGDALNMMTPTYRATISMAQELAYAWPLLGIEDKLLWVKRLEEGRDELTVILEYLSVWVRDVMLFKLGLYEYIVSEPSEEIQRQAQMADIALLLDRWQSLASLQSKIRSNVNRKLVIDELLLV
ncbi:MAG: DNA polymerase III subunit delta' [Bacillota bacterium]|nr:MAG: DNA polymerase III subunit delta' [Bacillota bacterium]MBS3950969.1 DNA polymerase III subunit delta' [Peptococcaceae bacterium]